MPKIKPLTKEGVWNESLTAEFKSRLYEKGWSSRHLAELLKTDPTTVSRVINHPLCHNFKLILSVADKLGADLNVWRR